MIAEYAQAKCQTLQRVAVGGFWTDAKRYPGLSFTRLRSHYQARPVPAFIWAICVSEIWRFPNLKELVLYYDWEETGGEHEQIAWSMDEAKDLLLSKLNEFRRLFRKWTTELPTVTFIRDLESL